MKLSRARFLRSSFRHNLQHVSCMASPKTRLPDARSKLLIRTYPTKSTARQNFEYQIQRSTRLSNYKVTYFNWFSVHWNSRLLLGPRSSPHATTRWCRTRPSFGKSTACKGVVKESEEHKLLPKQKRPNTRPISALNIQLPYFSC